VTGVEPPELVDGIDQTGRVVEVKVGGERLGVFREVLSDLLDQPAGVALGPEEVVGDVRAENALLEPDRELIPGLLRGLRSSMDFSASRTMTRIRSRRSWSRSALRSATAVGERGPASATSGA
jgi:hypothetical protein